MNSLRLKNIIKSYYIRHTPLYRSTLKNIRYEQSSEVNNLLNYAYKNIQYYNKQWNTIDILKYSNIPYLSKQDIIGRETELISKKYNKKSLIKKSTGGTSGISLNLYKPISDTIIETAFVDYAFSLILPLKELRIGVLRGNKPSKGLFEKQHNQYIMSSYDLSNSNINQYIEYIKENNINCLSVYPTAITIFCKYLLDAKIEIPEIKGILSSSEILTTESKKVIKQAFPNITLIDLYGQNEHVAFALSINAEPYKFYAQYGFTEFLDTGINNERGNKICEIVSTGFVNRAMPLIKYRTEDYVEIDPTGNIVSIIGRSQDFLVNKKGELVPCIVLTRDKTLDNVISFQYIQNIVGEVIFRVVANNKFADIDINNIIEDIDNTFSGNIKGRVEVVKHIEKTKAGKQKRLIQNINNIKSNI